VRLPIPPPRQRNEAEIIANTIVYANY
jgi:hypothetical protein